MSIEEKLKRIISPYLPNDQFKEVIEYSLYPAGKLFRSKLAIAIAKDASDYNENIDILCAAIECHHTYTLIHDDLPSMDDDDYRRGKLSSHKEYDEALAILAGDSLLNLSYELLSNIKSTEALKAIKIISSLTGPKGLILGQVMDLRGSINSLDDTITLHGLKTSNLIEAALSGSNILCNEHFNQLEIKTIAQDLGVSFQLIDDLLDLTEDISEREKDINPFIRFEQDLVFAKLNQSLKRMLAKIEKNNLKNVKLIVDEYLSNMSKKIKSQEKEILIHLKKLDIPSMSL